MTIKGLPTAKSVIENARQELVSRLNDYQHFHTSVFLSVVTVIQEEIMPTIRMHVMSGEAHIMSSNPVFREQLGLQILIDILSDRGFSVIVEKQDRRIPIKLEKKDQILSSNEQHFLFIVQFEKPTIMHKD
jgi:adenylate kinase